MLHAKGGKQPYHVKLFSRRFGYLAFNGKSSNCVLEKMHVCSNGITERLKVACKNRNLDEALFLVSLLHEKDTPTSCETLATLIEECGNIKSLKRGKKVHDHIIYEGLESNVLPANLLIGLYVKCGSLADATRWFLKMPIKDVFAWTLLIGAYSRHGSYQQSWKLFQMMVHDGVEPNNVTFLSILKACSCLIETKVIHNLIVDSGYDCDDFIRNTLLDIYSKCGSIQDAHALFEKLPKDNVVAWNAMIAAYAQHDLHEQAFYLFWQTQNKKVEPDEVTCLNLLKACIGKGSSIEGRIIHAFIIQTRMELNIFIANALIDMYSKDMCMADVQHIFNNLPNRDVVSWSVMIAAYVLHGYAHEALYHFGQMQLTSIKPNKVTYMNVLKACAKVLSLRKGQQVHMDIIWNHSDADICLMSSLIDVYCKCGSIHDAHSIFMSMTHRDAIVWNTLIDGYVEMGESDEALRLFWKMQSDGIVPDEGTFVSTLKACTDLTDMEQGKQIHSCAVELNMHVHVQVGNVLLDIYAKCGNVIEARHVFDTMHDRPMFVWTSAISGYIQNACGKEGLQLFDQMKQEGFAPGEVTFSTVSQACGTAADLELGKIIHVPIIQLRLESDVHVGNSLLDMYSKCGSLIHAQQVFDNMCHRDVVSYNTLISGYVHNGFWDKALEVFWQMQMTMVKVDKISLVCVLKACAGLAGLEQGILIHSLIIEDGYDGDDILKGMLVDMYTKCGSMAHARWVFDGITGPDTVTWTEIVFGYAQHGCGKEALQLLVEMLESGVRWDEITLVGVLAACGYAGLVNEGLRCFYVMNEEYGISWNSQHCTCITDILGRTGCLHYAMDLVNCFPCQPASIVWSTLLGACKLHGDVELAHYAVGHIYGLEPADVTATVLLSNIDTAFNIQMRTYSGL